MKASFQVTDPHMVTWLEITKYQGWVTQDLPEPFSNSELILNLLSCRFASVK